MLSATLFAGPTVAELDDPSRLAEVVGEPDHLLWLDLVDATDDDLERVRAEFDLHHLAIADAQREGARPKLVQYPTHALIVAYAADDDPTDLPELDLFVGPNWLVTMRKRNAAGRCVELEPLRSRYERTRTPGTGVGFLLYTILDHLVDGYFELTDRMDEAIETIEDRIFEELAPSASAGEPGDEPIQRELLHLRKGLLHVRRQVVPLREVVLALLRREVTWVEEQALVYLQNVLDHLLRVNDQIDEERELMGNAVDAHLATVSNRVNDIMKKMTSWGAILLGSTLIAGIYGMNFRYMPELDERWGYPASLAGMVVLTLVLYVYFRRKRWL